jgi:uncharacterized repeat protein (TIGR01451 family)
MVVAIAAACGGGPAGPSKINGTTTIAGTVNANGAAMSGGAATAPGAAATPHGTAATAPVSAATGLTVSVVGTNLSAAVESSGYFQLPGVPSGTVRLQFRDAGVDATVEISNVGQESLIEIQVQLTGTSAVIVEEVRSNSKVSLCHSTGTGLYHMIDVSDSAEPAHRAHGDGKVGDSVPGRPMMVFDQNCRAVGPAIQIKKSTNGEDADNAPGPTIVVGSPVTWQYVVTNTGTIPLTNVAVADNMNVAVTCPGTTLAVQQSMTCSGSGAAVAGQYSNVGTATASSTSGAVTDSDASHYFGQALVTDEGPKVQICHRTGNGSYHLIEISVSAEPAHRAHGDGKITEAVPGSPGKFFGAGCSVN